MKRSQLVSEARRTEWFHGSTSRSEFEFWSLPHTDDPVVSAWTRHRERQEGPGWYWSTDPRHASSHAGHYDERTRTYTEGCIYSGYLQRRVRILDGGAPADRPILAAVVRSAPAELEESWLRSFGAEPSAAAVRRVLKDYSGGTQLEGLVMLYRDLFRGDAQLYIECMRTVADVCLIEQSSEYPYDLHMIVYDPLVMRDVMTSC